MFVASEKEQISFPLDNANGSLKSSPMGSSPGYPDGLPPESDLPDSSSPPTVYTDVNIVPEHEMNELEKSILNLEGKSFWPLVTVRCCFEVLIEAK